MAGDPDVSASESARLLSGERGDEFDDEADVHVGATVVGYGAAAPPEHAPSHQSLSRDGAADDRTDISWSVESSEVPASQGGLPPGSGRKPAKAYIRRAKEKLRRKREMSLEGMPRRSCCHVIFVVVNAVALLSCLCMALSQVLPLIFVPLPLLQAALRGYLTFFCVIFCIAELEIPFPFIRSSQSLHDFKSKGFLFTFVAVVSMEQIVASDVGERLDELLAPYGSELGAVARVFIDVSCWLMLSVGLLYLLLGLLCMKRVRDRCREDYARRMEEYFDDRVHQLNPPPEFLA
mmetsp:Transcript_42068/g.127609  ORF Transcript_42068/g.127609 Transcript_42068/m.127609 type:complete len:292 (-) Transcript_42068:229-1104(-)|eukprot:CAMPEP_0113581420 /NCGR_PEP_ID=MMETSP0015_2-20120614/31288_1 /TAXON_ID=2838 /ORGANISM="Odontella" /LENGTH=291 /DNA_ID=CAMNT_0000485857 /DNA_START=625 /DNA_END=1500 /DNA_ORIENTATION=+ /assembly_acc=CAM_ASM_000160